MIDNDKTQAWKKPPSKANMADAKLRPTTEPLPPDGLIAVGFGYAGLHRDDEPFTGTERSRWRTPPDRRAEELAVTQTMIGGLCCTAAIRAHTFGTRLEVGFLSSQNMGFA